jgi:LPS-assembly protein
MFLFFVLFFLPQVALAAELSDPKRPNEDAPFLLIADEVIYDQDLETVTATGKVEVSSDGRVLKADTVSYNQRDGVVTASGNVSVTESTGEVAFAEYLQLDDRLKTGFIESVSMLMTDDSKLAANGARRYEDERTEMSKAVFSPCKACAKHPDRPLLWQVKAVKVIHRRDTREIEYQDATLEVFGIPVFYLPFFRHPDPTVDRASGFLAPKFGNDSEIGFSVETPYFFNIAPDRDFTFSPMITGKEGLVLKGEYRQLTETGKYQLGGSGTYTDKRDDDGEKTGGDEFRGHVDGKGLYLLDDNWRWGWNLAAASDDTYLKRYNISDEDTLTSNLFINKVDGTRFISASSYAFQGLKEEDDSDLTPFVAPMLEYSFLSDPVGDWGRFSFDASAVSLYRTGGTDTRRATIASKWESPHIGPLGDIYTFIASLRGDVYWSNDVIDESSGSSETDNEVETRLIPTLALDWRYPWIRRGDGYQHVIEPIVQAIYTPDNLNDGYIPNEDSISFEFDDSNLFSLNRFPGYDRVESGTRLNMGLKTAIYGDNGGQASFTIGQVYRFEDESPFPFKTGLDDDLSDIVAQITLSPASWLDVSNRVRINIDDRSLDRNEIYLALGPADYRLIGSYVRLEEEDPLLDIEPREEVYGAVRAKINDNWAISAFGRRDLTGSGRTIKTGGGVHYTDECVSFVISVDRDNTRDRDARPTTSINFRVVLKHLG